MIIEGKNPVLEALEAGTTIEKLYVIKGNFEANINRIVAAAKARRITPVFTTKDVLDKLSPTGRHQGALAVATEFEYSDLDEVLAAADESGKAPFIVIVDGVTDPHNLGGIIRSAECAGADCVVIPKHRAVGVTETVVKVSAGATEHLPVCKATNINDTIRALKQRNIYVYCADLDGETLYSVNLTGAIALVIGGEGDGVKRLTKELCDGVVSIPQAGKINSLNASVAAGIVIFEKVRQDNLKK